MLCPRCASPGPLCSQIIPSLPLLYINVRDQARPCSLFPMFPHQLVLPNRNTNKRLEGRGKGEATVSVPFSVCLRQNLQQSHASSLAPAHEGQTAMGDPNHGLKSHLLPLPFREGQVSFLFLSSRIPTVLYLTIYPFLYPIPCSKFTLRT